MKKTVFLTICLLFVATFASPALGQPENFFGKNPPGTEPVKFLSETLHQGLCPHGQLAFAPDGSGVFWSAIALEGRKQTIYWSAFDGNKFSTPVVAPFAAEAGNGGPAFSPDGRRLFFNVEISGPDATSPKTMAIAFVERSGSGWTKPVQIESTIDTQITKGQVSVARSGNIYFVGRILAERTPAIFVCRFADGRYSPPVKLAGAIASLPLVSDPWVDPDERFLLVSSPPAEGPPMLTDIGISSRLSDGTWSKPVRLSGPVNTTAFERFALLSSDGKYLFFIRASGQQFVSDQARFYWVETKDIPELQAKAPVLSGPLLGQKPPGMTPEIFAPGVVSREGLQMKMTMSADGSQILYTERDPATTAISFIIRHRKGDSWSEPVILPLAQDYMDLEPSLCPDGKAIFFTSVRPPSGQGEPEKLPDIWMVEKTGDQWGSPVHLGPPVNTGAADIEAHPFIGPDDALYFVRQVEKTRRLLRAGRRDGGFDEPRPLPLKEDLLVEQFSGPCLSPDGRIMMMHSRKPGGFGNWDLYASFKGEAGEWSVFKNLGAAVNTDKQEAHPSFSPDGRYLFFDRDGDILWISAKILDDLRPTRSERGGFPALTGPFLGQKPPGMTPEVFAPGIVSTEGVREFSGAFSPDGTEYYFFRFGTAPDMMVSRLVGNVWTKPRPAEFDTEFIDNEPHITGDGKTFFFCSNRPYPGSGEGRRMTQVWMMRREGTSWGTPRHLLEGMSPSSSARGDVFIATRIYQLTAEDRLVEIGRLQPDPSVPEAEWLPHPHTFMSPDESFHLFDFKDKLYVSFRTKDGNWGRPVDLSARLNLEGGIMLPTLSPDGRYLFFCHQDDIYWVSTKVIDGLRF